MLSDMQKAQCRLYLGYPDAFRYKDTRLEGMLDNLSYDAEVLISSQLARLATIETVLLEAGGEDAGIKRVDEIWFENGWVRTAQIRKNGRMYVGRISIIMGVPVYSDVFGTQGYLGDTFSGMGGSGGNGGFFGLG